MTRTALIATLALLPGVAAAAEPPPLDEEFLDYLAQFDGEADDWTWFAADDDAAQEDDSKRTEPSAPRMKEVER